MRSRKVKYKCTSKIYSPQKETLQKRKCLRCDKLFKPPNKFRFSCDSCNKYIDASNQNGD